MIKNKSFGDKIFDGFNIILMLFISFVFLLPFIHIVFSSISDPAILAQNSGIILWPKGITLNGYVLVFKNPNIISGFTNSVFYVAAGTFLNILFTSIIAYVLSRRNLLWKNSIMFMVVLTMIFTRSLIPFYLLVRGLGLRNTRLALLLPDLVIVWNFLIMRTAFAETPYELEEAATIDGANHLRIFFNIILPVSKAVIAVNVLFYAVFHWNSWFNAMIFLNKRELFPLQLILREILILNDTSSMANAENVAYENVNYYKVLVQYATIIVATVPILMIYPLIQKHFAKGVMIGSLKG